MLPILSSPRRILVYCLLTVSPRSWFRRWLTGVLLGLLKRGNIDCPPRERLPSPNVFKMSDGQMTKRLARHDLACFRHGAFVTSTVVARYEEDELRNNVEPKVQSVVG